MREHDALLFMGAGDRSTYAADRLKKRLKQAMDTLSAWQQGSPQVLEEIVEVEDTVRDIAAALLGREVIFGAELPYPGKLPMAPDDIPIRRLTVARKTRSSAT
jgi:hypothetical protein